MVQVENEYGSYGNTGGNPQDLAYMEHLRDFAYANLGGPDAIQLYTTDGLVLVSRLPLLNSPHSLCSTPLAPRLRSTTPCSASRLHTLLLYLSPNHPLFRSPPLPLSLHPLFSSSVSGDVGYLSHGAVPGVFATGDGGCGDTCDDFFAAEDQFNPPGMRAHTDSEYYTGWLTHWGECLTIHLSSHCNSSF